MKRTPIAGLIGVAVFAGLLALIATWGFYGSFSRVPVAAAIVPLVLALICAVLTMRVRSRKRDGRIGQDSSQLSPVTVAQFLVVGKASAWTGAVTGGGYAGMALWLLPQAGRLDAAAADAPAVLVALAGSVAWCIAGVALERNCEVPPPPPEEPIR